MARLGSHTVGPFSWWVWKGNYPIFVPAQELRERVRRYLTEYSLSVPTASMRRAYIDSRTDVWLYVETTAYDLVKHFKGDPILRRRLGSLWCLRCPVCGFYLPTSPTSEPACEVCGGQADIVIFWTDPESRVFLTGPCNPSHGRIYVGGKGYFVGEVLSVKRSLNGDLYANVIGFHGEPAGLEPDRLVNVSDLPQIGWRRPLMIEEVARV